MFNCAMNCLCLSRGIFHIQQNDHVRRFDQLSRKTYINMFRGHGGVFACDMAGQGQG